jgi:prolyl 4-hydroxylase
MTTAAAQTITPALRQWIIDQAQAGFGRVGAQVDDRLGLERRRGHRGHGVHAAGPPRETAVASGLPPAVPVPEPSPLDDSTPVPGRRRPAGACAAGHVQPARGRLWRPAVDEECDALIEAAKPRLARSLTVATKTGGEEVNADRTSKGMFFQRGEGELVAASRRALRGW